MARQRRGGGFRPPEIRGTLGTLLRTTLEQAGAVRDALERGARSGRSRLDEALSSRRRRRDALADLGALVLDLIRRGEIDLAELPEAHEIVHFLDDLDSDAADSPSDPEARLSSDDRIAQPPTRRHFDDRSDSRDDDARSRDRDSDDSTVSATRAPRARDRSRDRDSDDGTVSATRGSHASRGPGNPGGDRWSPPKPSAPQRVWRPSLVDDDPPPAPRDLRDPRDPPAPRAPSSSSRPFPSDPARKGGIQFDDDDLADYMHPDDVPPKPPTDGDP